VARSLRLKVMSGNQSLSEHDKKLLHEDYRYVAPVYDDLRRAIAVFDADCPLGHLPKLELVRGDLVETALAYMHDNPETIWRIISLSVNVFRPSAAAIKAFWPRLQSGGILCVHALGTNSGAVMAVESAFAEMGEPVPSFRVHDYWPESYYATKG
jgi:hypothetical protein